MRVVILGSGTLEPNSDRTSPAHYLEGEGFKLLMDCGAETAGSLARWQLPWRELTHIVLTHFHTDHVGGLPALLWAMTHRGGTQIQELTVLGPPGLSEVLDRIAVAFGGFIRQPGRELSIHELERSDRWRHPSARFVLETRPTRHTESSVALRVECTEGVVGYTGDTGPCDAVGECLGNAHIGIAECARPDTDEDPHHLRPQDLAALLAGREPQMLFTTHAYPPLDPESVPDLIRARGYTGSVMAGRDGLDARVVNGQVGIRPFRAHAE